MARKKLTSTDDTESTPVEDSTGVELPDEGEAIAPPDTPDAPDDDPQPSPPDDFIFQGGRCPACGSKVRTGLDGGVICAAPTTFPDCPRNAH